MKKSNSHKRILIAFPRPHIDWHPTLVFMINQLTELNISVEVLVATEEKVPVPSSLPSSIQIHTSSAEYFMNAHRFAFRGLPKRLCLYGLRSGYFTGQFSSMYPLEWDPSALFLQPGRQYDAVLGCDPEGIGIAQRLAKEFGCPLVYLSFELMLSEDVFRAEHQELKELDKRGAQKASLVLIQDEERAEIFCRENSVSMDKVALVPVAPSPEFPPKNNSLRESLQISDDTRIVLFAGNPSEFSCRGSWAEMVSYWPDNFCLVVNSWYQMDSSWSRFFQQLRETGRIFITEKPVAQEDLASLHRSADYALASYWPCPGYWLTSGNLYHLGLASGKVSYAAMCGLPILARKLPVFDREFSDYQCGLVYEKLAETGRLLSTMDANYDQYSAEARRFYDERLDPTESMREFCGRLIAVMENGS